MTASAIAGVRRQVRELVDGTLEVRIHVEPIHKAEFHRLFPDVDMAVALAPLNSPAVRENTAPEKDSAYNRGAGNELARQMHVDGFFRNRKLWLAMHAKGIYALKQHKAVVESQKCCMVYIWDRLPDARLTPCEGEVCAHHTDGAELPAAGARLQPDAPQKPLHFYTVPLCHSHHTWAHNKDARREDKRVLLEYAVELTAMQVKAAMKRWLKIESLREITAEMLAKFHTEVGL